MFLSQSLTPQGVRIVCLLCFGTACLSSLIPAMGFFIVEGLNEPAWKIGIYTGLATPLTMVVNRQFGRMIDNRVPIRWLLGVAVAGYTLFATILALGPSFAVLVLCGAPLMALANSASATTFSYGRLYAVESALNVPRYNSLLRSSTSFAWMLAPAASFILIAQFGFQKTYLISAILGVLWLAMWHFIVPATYRAPERKEIGPATVGFDWPLWLAALACTLFALGNVLFTAALPIYTIKEIGLPGSTPGLMLTAKCLVEVIAIFTAPRLVQITGSRPILLIAAALSVVVFLMMSQIETQHGAIATALLEGLYYGLFAGVSITYIQDFIPTQPGKATAIYMNCLFMGSMIGSVSMGIIASATDFRTVVYVAAMVGAGAFFTLLLTRKVGAARR
ncbi:MFS transporter [Roseibium suaedae]|uniref:MFS transporter, SET family, sugar efflux transporter n=1 Tax=Roseibium suaedae TaxID=735517 RepID=A0A1M7MG77_9HYPH|nr:MFS transporter [Roseibium suaedae]SHM89849.1 MFS transporter, SET family, sugar efflux transporter [Roseibium suaedae]